MLVLPWIAVGTTYLGEIVRVSVIRTRPSSYMVVCADVTCGLCSRRAATVEAELTGAGPRRLQFQVVRSSAAPSTDWRQIRCATCGGSTFLDDFETMRRRTDTVDWTLDAPRRGRPPRWLVERRRLDEA
jgi:hypothetical protein